MKDVNALCLCVIITRVMLECRCPDMTRTKREPFIRALRVLCKTCRPNSEASYVGRVLLFLVYVSGRVSSAKTCLFGLFHFEAFIRHHHVPVSGGFNSHHDSVKPLFHYPLLDRLKRHLDLASSRSASYLSFKLILYPNSDSTSQLTRLTSSGDISLNPGPERYSLWKFRRLKPSFPSCDSRELWCHIKCGLITQREFKRFQSLQKIQLNFPRLSCLVFFCAYWPEIYLLSFDLWPWPN